MAGPTSVLRPKGVYVVRLFESRERRQVRKVRQALDRFVAAMIRLYAHTWYVAGGKHVRSLIVLIEDHVEVFVADLVKIERDLRVGHVDWDRVKTVNASLRNLKRQMLGIDRSLRDTRLGPALSPVSKSLDELETAMRGLHRPQTRFQRNLAAIMGKCRLTAYAVSVMSGVDRSHVLRLLSGEKRNASRAVVLAIASAVQKHAEENFCRVSARDLERLVEAAGYRLQATAKQG